MLLIDSNRFYTRDKPSDNNSIIVIAFDSGSVDISTFCLGICTMIWISRGAGEQSAIKCTALRSIVKLLIRPGVEPKPLP